MTSTDASIKIDQRLNKLASADFANILDWQKEEAVEKAILDYFRRNKHGGNQYREGDESSTQRIDDFQILIKTKELSIGDRDRFVETYKVPEDYLYFKRVTPICSKGNCVNVTITSTLKEEANVDELIGSTNSQPSFDFEQTFHTMAANRFKVYHNNDFTITKVSLTYYRKPAKISFTNSQLMDTLWEWKDDVAEQIIDEACKIIAGDTNASNNYQISDTRIEKNN